MDHHFSSEQFEDLYRTWVDNSIDLTIADKVILAIHKDKGLAGFITLKLHKNSLRIGLLCIFSQFRGEGIGGMLIQTSKAMALENDLGFVFVATQKANTEACGFYEKKGFVEVENKMVYHYWNMKE